MNFESYTDLEIFSDKLKYKFTSNGPKGLFNKTKIALTL